LPDRLEVRPGVRFERLLPVECGHPIRGGFDAPVDVGRQSVEYRQEQFLFAAEVVVDAVEAGSGVVDDIGHRGGGERARGEQLCRGGGRRGSHAMKLAHRAPFSYTVLEFDFPSPSLLRGSGQSLVHLRGVRPPGTTCFAFLAPPWWHACGILCLVGDVAEPIPAVHFRH
jgi:hypothetical protein